MVIRMDVWIPEKIAVAIERLTSQLCTDRYAIELKGVGRVSLPNKSVLKVEISNLESHRTGYVLLSVDLGTKRSMQRKTLQL